MFRPKVDVEYPSRILLGVLLPPVKHDLLIARAGRLLEVPKDRAICRTVPTMRL